MKQIVSIPPDLTKKVLQGVAIAGGTYLLYYFGRKALESYIQRHTSSRADESKEVRQAMSLRSAMNPSGVSWLIWSDGTEESAINELAAEITNWDSVMAAYRNLYKTEIMEDLQSELNTTALNSFLQKIANNKINLSTGNGSSGGTSSSYTRPMNLVVAKVAVNLRTSPNATNHDAWYEIISKSNIFKTAQPGEFIGYATGKQQFDAVNNVKFIEVAYRNLSSGDAKILWVSSSTSYVDQFTSASAMEAKYPSTKGITNVYQPINGLGILPRMGNRAVSRCETNLYDKNFKPISIVKGNVLIGYPMMNLSGKGVNYTLIKTPQGLERWIMSNHLIIK